MPKRPLIWLTRPQADSEKLAATLVAHRIETVISPVMRITPVPVAQVPALPDAILLTSRHAVPALLRLPDGAHGLPLFCVGSATADTAAALGFRNIRTAEGDILSLLPMMTGALAAGAKLLYFAGEETRVNVPVLLGAHGIVVEQITAYTADALASLSPELAGALVAETLTGASFYSPRSGALAVTLLQHADFTDIAAQMDAFCLSLAVAQSVASLNWKSLHVCAAPTSAAMRDLIVSKNLL